MLDHTIPSALAPNVPEVFDSPVERECSQGNGSGYNFGICTPRAGHLGNPGALLRAARSLVEEEGCEAIAVIGRFPDDDLEKLENYRQCAFKTLANPS